MVITVMVSELQPPTEPGALSGYNITCGECGPLHRCSIKSMAAQRAQEHRAWHAQFEESECYACQVDVCPEHDVEAYAYDRMIES